MFITFAKYAIILNKFLNLCIFCIKKGFRIEIIIQRALLLLQSQIILMLSCFLDSGCGSNLIYFRLSRSKWSARRKLYTKNQLPRLPGNALKVSVVAVVVGLGGGFLSIMWLHQLRIGLKLVCYNR